MTTPDTSDLSRLESEIFDWVRSAVLADRSRRVAGLIGWARGYARERLCTHRLSTREVRLVDGAVNSGVASAQAEIDAQQHWGRS